MVGPVGIAGHGRTGVDEAADHTAAIGRPARGGSAGSDTKRSNTRVTPPLCRELSNERPRIGSTGVRRWAVSGLSDQLVEHLPHRGLIPAHDRGGRRDVAVGVGVPPW